MNRLQSIHFFRGGASRRQKNKEKERKKERKKEREKKKGKEELYETDWYETVPQYTLTS